MKINRQICWLAAVGAMVSVQGGASLAALPFTLELVALKGLPQKTFSITLSVEPAIAALSGFFLLSERLTVLQLLAMACVITASIGSVLTVDR